MRQERFDGFEIEKNEVRFTGKLDLDATDKAALELDSIAFAIVSFRVNGSTVTSNDKGDVKRIDCLKPQEFRVATGDMRETCIDFLMGKSPQQQLDFNEKNGIASREEKAEELKFMESRNTPQEGPKVAKFSDDLFDSSGAPADYEAEPPVAVARTGSTGDSILRDFMSEDF